MKFQLLQATLAFLVSVIKMKILQVTKDSYGGMSIPLHQYETLVTNQW